MDPEGNQNMHVLYLPRWYPHRYDPMPGLFIQRHGIAASAHCRVTVLYVHPDEQMQGSKADFLESTGEPLPTLRIYYRKYRSILKFPDKLVNAWRFYKYHRIGMRRIREKHGHADLLHVHVLTRHGLIAYLYKRLNGTPYVITEHWTRYLPSTHTYYGWLRKKITNIVAAGASCIMPVTSNLKDAMIRCGLKNDNYVIIPNVVNTSMFHPASKKANGKIRMVHISCFDDQQKNISGMFRVLKEISAERNDFVCDMVGEGIDYDDLRAYADSLGLDKDTVIFYGLRENEELARIMARGKFMVMFSNYENLPVVILESYACGVPVISTDVGGIREHLNDRLGILIEPGNEKQLKDSIVYMLDHPDDYDQKYLRKYALEHFSNTVIGNQLFDVYRNILKQ